MAKDWEDSISEFMLPNMILCPSLQDDVSHPLNPPALLTLQKPNLVVTKDHTKKQPCPWLQTINLPLNNLMCPMSITQLQAQTTIQFIQNTNIPPPEPNPKLHLILSPEPDPKPDCFKFEPTTHRRMSSRVLGEDVEKIRDELIVKSVDGEELIVLEGKMCPENKELFSRSIIASAASSMTLNQLMENIFVEGVSYLTIKPLGGMLHLITFSSLEDKVVTIESKWLEKWFLDLCNVNEKCAPRWRSVQIRIFGVPLSCWGYETSIKLDVPLVRFLRWITQTLIMHMFSYIRIVCSQSNAPSH